MRRKPSRTHLAPMVHHPGADTQGRALPTPAPRRVSPQLERHDVCATPRRSFAGRAIERRLRCVFGASNFRPSFVCSRDCTTVSVPDLKSISLHRMPRISPRRSPVVTAKKTGVWSRFPSNRPRSLAVSSSSKRPHLFTFGFRRLDSVHRIPRHQLPPNGLCKGPCGAPDGNARRSALRALPSRPYGR